LRREPGGRGSARGTSSDPGEGCFGGRGGKNAGEFISDGQEFPRADNLPSLGPFFRPKTSFPKNPLLPDVFPRSPFLKSIYAFFPETRFLPFKIRNPLFYPTILGFFFFPPPGKDPLSWYVFRYFSSTKYFPPPPTKICRDSSLLFSSIYRIFFPPPPAPVKCPPENRFPRRLFRSFFPSYERWAVPPGSGVF